MSGSLLFHKVAHTRKKYPGVFLNVLMILFCSEGTHLGALPVSRDHEALKLQVSKHLNPKFYLAFNSTDFWFSELNWIIDYLIRITFNVAVCWQRWGVSAKFGANLSHAFRPFAIAYCVLILNVHEKYCICVFSKANARVSKWAAPQLKDSADSINAQLCSLHVNTPV